MEAVMLYTQLAQQTGIVTPQATVKVRLPDGTTTTLAALEADTETDTVTLITSE